MNMENERKANEKDAMEAVLRLKETAPEHCVAIRLSLTSQGYRVKYETRNPEALRCENISMRDIHGNWIK